MTESRVKPESVDPAHLRTLLLDMASIAGLPSLDDQLNAISRVFGVNDIHVVLVIHHLMGHSLELQDVKQVQTEQFHDRLLNMTNTRNMH